MSGTTGNSDSTGNTAYGTSALIDVLNNPLTTPQNGANNTAFGKNALHDLNHDVNENSAFGAYALSRNDGGENSAFGAYAAANEVGHRVSAFGNWALRYNKGDENTAIGYRAMAGDKNDNTDPDPSGLTYPQGYRNTAIGVNAMRYNPDGHSNTSVGYGTLEKITTGANLNTAVGSSAGPLITEGSSNTLIGVSSGAKLTEGSSNTLIGINSGVSITIGNSNTILGAGADVGDGNAGFRTVVGAGAASDKDNTVILGRAVEDIVGIGITAPSSKMHIVNNDDEIPALNVDGGHVVKTHLPDGDEESVTNIVANVNDYIIIVPEGSDVITVELPDPNVVAKGTIFIINNYKTTENDNVTITTANNRDFIRGTIAASTTTLTLNAVEYGIAGTPNGVTVVSQPDTGYYVLNEYYGLSP